MKKIIPLLIMSLLLFVTADVQAQGFCGDLCNYVDSCCVDERKFYAKILSGANFLQKIALQGNKSTYQTGYVIGGSLGYCWRYGLRLEAEYGYRRNDIKTIHFYAEGFSNHGNFQASSYMANLLWDWPLSSWGCTFWNIQPFVGAGIGYDYQHMHSSNSRIVFDQKWKHFSWQMMAGLVYPIFCNTEISLEYKFHQGGCHFYNHSVGVGLLYKLDFFRY
jgi:opacity protein-like surface antigen